MVILLRKIIVYAIVCALLFLVPTIIDDAYLLNKFSTYLSNGYAGHSAKFVMGLRRNFEFGAGVEFWFGVVLHGNDLKAKDSASTYWFRRPCQILWCGITSKHFHLIWATFSLFYLCSARWNFHTCFIFNVSGLVHVQRDV